MARALPISLLAVLAMVATTIQRPVSGQDPTMPLPFASMSPEMKAAREKQLRAAIAEPGFRFEERKKQLLELGHLLAAMGKPKESVALWEPWVKKAESLGHYRGDAMDSRDLFDLAEWYHQAGEHDKAEAVFAERVAEMTECFGPRSIITEVAKDRLLNAYLRAKKLDQAVDLWEKRAASLAKSDPLRRAVNILLVMGLVTHKKLEQLDRIIQLSVGDEPPTSYAELSTRMTLVKLQVDGGLHDRGRELLDRELVELRRTKGVDSTEVIELTDQLGRACLSYGLNDLASEKLRDAQSLLEKKYGADHEQALKFHVNHAALLITLQRTKEAVAIYADITPRLKKHLGVDHPLTQQAVANYLWGLESIGQYAVAEPFRREAIKEFTEAGKEPEDPKFVEVRALLALNLLQQSKGVEAEEILRDVLKVRRKLAPQVWTTFNAASMLGEALLIQKKYDEAEPLLKEGFQGILKDRTQNPPGAYTRLPDAARRLVTLYDETNRRAEADKYRSYLPRVPK
ncbi:MAG: tetratricopeptide repeat protein [Pirellulales bacterium]